MAELAPLKYGKVVGRFLANVIDGPDIEDLPEFPPLTGTITFAAEAPKILVADGVPAPATYVQLPKHYTASLDEFGYLTWRGDRGVRLVAPSADTNPADWTWRVTFDLEYDGDPVIIAPFSFEVVEYLPGPDPEDPDTGSTGLVDLTVVSPVPASPGDAVVRGPQGEGIQVDRKVATYAALPSVPPEGDGAQYVVTADGLLYVYRTGDGWMADGQGVIIRGPQGITGLTGATGPANELEIGSVTTGTPGSSAGALITGTPPNQVLDLTIPRGDVGATGPAAPDATTSVKGIVQLAGVLAGTAAAPAFNAAAFGATSSTACVGNDARLSNTRTPTAGTSPYDLNVCGFGKDTVRAAGTGDFPMGVKLQRAAVFTSVTYRASTPDASGNLVVELRKNGVAVSGSAATIAAASQVAGGTSTGSWSFSVGDILTVQVTAVGTTPGKGLVADITGLA
ncbi:hypothetical protein ACTWPB_07690 [Nocardia sp. IBHARD005]|uniref:hypothetical protein n=1 Tax=Nocardia sp. IBHARD005 TaxID=3457765 RepID=UPI00405A2428